MEVQWLRLCASTKGGMSSVPGQGPVRPINKEKKEN